MTENQEKYLELVIIEQVNFNDVPLRLDIDRITVSRWWDELKKEREYLADLRKTWMSKFKNTETTNSFWDFKKWYEETERKCFYCNINEEKINELYTKYGELTKRSRGRKLEIDRKEPEEDYDNIDNLVLSCYWCNNAKTDTFTEAEFKIIGKEIEKIWNKRLEE